MTGPDNKSYRLDTYINYSCVSGTLVVSPLSCGSTSPAPVKLVTIVVKSTGGTGLGTTGAVSVREQSAFTSLEGQ